MTKEQLQALLNKLKAAQASAQDLLGKARGESDTEKAKSFRTAAQAKSAEVTELMAEYQEVKAAFEAQTAIESLEASLKPDESGKSLNPAGKPIQQTTQGAQIIGVSDDVKEEIQKRNFFMRYMKGGAKSLQGEEYLAIAPQDSRIKKLDLAEPALLPRNMVAAIIHQGSVDGKSFGPDGQELIGGKVMLSTDATGGATDSGGANLVPPDFRPVLLREPVYMPQLYDFARLIPAAYGKATWPMLDQDQGLFGGVAFTWKATEGADKGETEPTFKQFEITTHELSGWTEVSLTMLSRSAIQLESELTTLFRDAARYEFSKQMLTGNGTNKPKGIIATSGVNLVPREVANEVSYTDLTRMEFAVKKGHRANARYVLDDTVEGGLALVLDGMGRPLFSADTTSGPLTRLRGYSYETHEYTPALGTKGDVVFGNLNAYGFAVEQDIAIARSEHAEFKKGLVVYRMIAFVGGKVIFPKAFSVLDDPE